MGLLTVNDYFRCSLIIQCQLCRIRCCVLRVLCDWRHGRVQPVHRKTNGSIGLVVPLSEFWVKPHISVVSLMKVMFVISDTARFGLKMNLNRFIVFQDSLRVSWAPNILNAIFCYIIVNTSDWLKISLKRVIKGSLQKTQGETAVIFILFLAQY